MPPGRPAVRRGGRADVAVRTRSRGRPASRSWPSRAARSTTAPARRWRRRWRRPATAWGWRASGAGRVPIAPSRRCRRAAAPRCTCSPRRARRLRRPPATSLPGRSLAAVPSPRGSGSRRTAAVCPGSWWWRRHRTAGWRSAGPPPRRPRVRRAAGRGRLAGAAAIRRGRRAGPAAGCPARPALPARCPGVSRARPSAGGRGSRAPGRGTRPSNRLRPGSAGFVPPPPGAGR